MIPSADTILSHFVIKAKFRHVQVLIKLAELGSMRRAAEAVNMTQPAVSQKIAELERLIGAELFLRHSKGVEPTAVANELLPVAHRIFSALEDGSETIAHHLRASSGFVRVVASPAATGGLLLGTLGPFSQAHPSIQVRVIESTAAQLTDGLLVNQADIICTRRTDIVPEGWKFVTCLEDQLVLVCGAHHPLANKKNISGAQLGEHKWLINRVGSVAREYFETLFEEHSWEEDVRGSLVLHVPTLTRELLMTQDVLAVIPQSVAQPWLRAGDVVALNTELTKELPPLGILRPEKNLGVAIETFVTFVESALVEKNGAGKKGTKKGTEKFRK